MPPREPVPPRQPPSPGRPATPPRGQVPPRPPQRGAQGRPPRPPQGRPPRRYTGPTPPPGANEETVIFAPVGKGGTATEEKPAPAALGKGGVAIRTAGEILITLGLVVLLFMVYELYVTDLFSAGKQSEASDQLDGEWAHDRTLHPELIDGKAFARIHIPSFGVDYNFTIQEGTDDAALEVGPGHYKGTSLPGEPGNFAVAGHRVGKGAPFNDLDNLSSCDQIVIETSSDFYIYKVLPYDDEMKDWAAGKGTDPKCKGVSTLRDQNAEDGGAYSETFGRKVVLPSQGTAVNPVPYKGAEVLPKAQQAALLTLTTCHPQFSAKERLIITSVLTQQVPKNQVKDYGDLLSKIGEA
ncbi:class E sortase [Amycolatopsis sp. NPDC024027]|uniref:class E sortase n=1 Tax=Amycolatopsis sp. NPDC024027 TaxID=3154327 RepID=UPI0033F7F184